MKIIREGRQRVVDPPADLKDLLAKRLTFFNPVYRKLRDVGATQWTLDQTPKKLHFAAETENGIVVPRGHRIFGYKGPVPVIDKSVAIKATFPATKLPLRPLQREIAEEFEQVYRDHPIRSYLLQIPTAEGKTILGLQLARMLGHRTLVLTHSDLIKRGWFKDIPLFLDMPVSDVGMIQGNNFSIGDELTVGMVQTIERREEYWDELYDNFGLIILDEPDQYLNRKKIFEFLYDAPAKHMIGLTATPYIKDGQFYMTMMFGATPMITRKIGSSEGKNAAMSVTSVNVFTTAFTYDFEDGVISWTKMLPTLTCDEARNELIVEKVVADLERGETVLVNTKTLNHLNILTDMLEARGVDGIIHVTGETNSQKQKTHMSLELIQNRHCRCVIASTAIKAGVNIPQLSSIHFAVPYANQRDIEQLIGRVRRQAQNKSSCIVNYYLDLNVQYLLTIYKRYAKPVFDVHCPVGETRKESEYRKRVKRISNIP